MIDRPLKLGVKERWDLEDLLKKEIRVVKVRDFLL